MNIRKYREADLERILAITAVAWNGYTLGQIIEDRHGPLGISRGLEQKVKDISEDCKIKSDSLIVAEENGVVAGYGFFRIDKDNKIGYVLNNAVDPAFQGRGIGGAMNSWILDLFRREGMKVAMLGTLEHDAPARRMYEKNGFKEIAKTVHYTLDLGV